MFWRNPNTEKIHIIILHNIFLNIFHYYLFLTCKVYRIAYKYSILVSGEYNNDNLDNISEIKSKNDKYRFVYYPMSYYIDVYESGNKIGYIDNSDDNLIPRLNILELINKPLTLVDHRKNKFNKIIK